MQKRRGFIIATVIAIVIIITSIAVVYYSNLIGSRYASQKPTLSQHTQTNKTTTSSEHKAEITKLCSSGIIINNVNRTILNEIVELSEKFGILIDNNSRTYYVIIFVSPTCPFCKTEILSLEQVLTSMKNISVIIVPVPEHGFPDMLNVAVLYCILEKYGSKIAFRALLDMYHDYYTRGSEIYYPNLINISRTYGIVDITKCIGFYNYTTLIYGTYPQYRNLHATFINCTKPFYEECMKNVDNSTKCREECSIYINMQINKTISKLIGMYRNLMTKQSLNISELESYNSNLDRAIRSLIVWIFVNLKLHKEILKGLGTPEIIYVDTNSSRVLIYLGLQIPMSKVREYIPYVWSTVVPYNKVPRDLQDEVYSVFTSCMRALVSPAKS